MAADSAAMAGGATADGDGDGAGPTGVTAIIPTGITAIIPTAPITITAMARITAIPTGMADASVFGRYTTDTADTSDAITSTCADKR